MAISPVDARVKVLCELGLTDTAKVRQTLVNALVVQPNRYPLYVLQEAYDAMLKDFYNGNTQYVKGE